jgi:hypothetical protein
VHGAVAWLDGGGAEARQLGGDDAFGLFGAGSDEAE